MEQLFKEEDFYKDNGWPSERLIYSKYILNNVGDDYDQFILVVNAEYPYIRLSPKRGNCQFPCGGFSVIATDGNFARKSDTEREKECPKIAWGFAAVYLINLRYDRAQDDYVELKERDIFIRDYYCKYLKMYLDNHNGLRYSKLSTEQKELDFIAEHEVIIRGLWERSTPLTKYPVLFEYAKNAEKDYETYLANRKKEIQKKVIEPGAIFDEKNSKNRTIIQNGDKSLYVENNNGTIIIGTDMHKRMNFSTEIRETFGKQYVKVYFLDDSIAKDAKEVVERLNVIKTVNITPSASKDHPGNTLTVYPKSMVEAEDCEKEMVEALNRFFSRGILADKKPVRNDAYFNDIADKIIKDLDKARVSIHVCMAWFTNQSIADKLVEKHKQGIDVKVIFYDDHTNSSKEDESEENIASIAFIWEYNDARILFLGDAAPKVVIETIKEKYTGRLPLKLLVTKMSHHGSMYSTSLQLFETIKTRHYIFTGGNQKERPSEATIAKILTSSLDGNEQLHYLHFNHKNPITERYVNAPIKIKTALNFEADYNQIDAFKI